VLHEIPANYDHIWSLASWVKLQFGLNRLINLLLAHTEMYFCGLSHKWKSL